MSNRLHTAALVATLALTGCGASTKPASSTPAPVQTRSTSETPATNPNVPSAGDTCDAAKLGAIEIPGQKHLVCLNGKWTPEKRVRAGASCAAYDPVKLGPYGTLPANIDCNKATQKFVAEGEVCDPGKYIPTIGHLYCDAGSGKLSSKPKRITQCKPGETRTIAPGIVEKCVPVPQPTITNP